MFWPELFPKMSFWFAILYQPSSTCWPRRFWQFSPKWIPRSVLAFPPTRTEACKGWMRVDVCGCVCVWVYIMEISMTGWYMCVCVKFTCLIKVWQAWRSTKITSSIIYCIVDVALSLQWKTTSRDLWMSTSVAFPAKSLHPVAWMKCHAQCPCVIHDVDEGYATRLPGPCYTWKLSQLCHQSKNRINQISLDCVGSLPPFPRFIEEADPVCPERSCCQRGHNGFLGCVSRWQGPLVHFQPAAASTPS